MSFIKAKNCECLTTTGTFEEGSCKNEERETQWIALVKTGALKG